LLYFKTNTTHFNSNTDRVYTYTPVLPSLSMFSVD